MLLEGAERSRLTLKAEGLVPVVQMGSGEDDEKTGVVPRAEESTVVQWAGEADKSLGAVQGLEPELRPCFPSFTYVTELLVSIATGARMRTISLMFICAHACKELSKKY